MKNIKSSPSELTLHSLIQRYDWEAVTARIREHPNETKIQHARHGTPLHALCSIGSAPVAVVSEVLQHWPAAASTKNIKYGETPLHLQCRNSQRSFSKVALLLKECPSAASVTNKQGMSPLHVACEANAMLPVVKILAKADPSMLLRPNSDGFTPIGVLWNTYARTMHGHASLNAARTAAQPIGGDKRPNETPTGFMHDHVTNRYTARWTEQIPEGHFRRFWEKMQHLTLAAYTSVPHDDMEIQEDNSRSLAHAILSVKGCPNNFLSLVLWFNPSFAMEFDAGCYPLHLLVAKPPNGKDDVSLLKVLLRINSYAAGVPDGEGRMPLSLAAENGWDWESVSALVSAHPDELGLHDIKTLLCPFMLAASSSSNHAFENSYRLLLARPELVERD